MFKRSDVKDAYPLSPTQEGMLFHYLFHKDSPVYYRQISFRANGKINRQLFEQALNHLVDRHDVFRTIFIHEKVKKPLQVVFKKRKIIVNYKDISKLKPAEKINLLKEFKRKDKETGFDLSKDRPLRVAIIKISREEYEILWSHHHIIMDGWSSGLFIAELMTVYRDLSSGTPVNLPPVPQYGTYIQWLERQDIEQGSRFWNAYLENYENTAVIPVSNRENEKKYQQAKFTLKLNKHLTGLLHRLADQRNVTINTFLQTVWGILLQRYNLQEDVVYGLVVSGRPPEIPGIEQMIGLFVNTIPIRIRSESSEPFVNLLSRVQQHMLCSGKYDYTPLVEIQAATQLKQALFNHVLVFENYPLDKYIDNPDDPGGLGFSASALSSFEQSGYNLDVVVVPGAELEITFRYNSLVYDAVLMQKTAGYLEHIIRQVIHQPGIRLKEIEILSRTERKQVLAEFIHTKADEPSEKTLDIIFARQAEQSPHHVALLGENPKSEIRNPKHKEELFGQINACGDNVSLTYKELNEKSNQLAQRLGEKGVKPDTIAGIMMERSLDMIIGILGILKAGGAYLPIDPDYPEERVQYMLADSGAKILVTSPVLSKKIEKLSIVNCQLLMINDKPPNRRRLNNPPKEANSINNYQLTINNLQLKMNSLAYIIYTSGTTGRPKGVMIEHRNVVRLLFNNKSRFNFSDQDVWTMFHSYCFDFSVWEMFGALLYGGKLVIVPRMIARDPIKFLNLLEKQAVTVLNQVPSAFYHLVHEVFKPPGQGPVKKFNLFLRLIIFGGEALKPAMLKRWREKYPAAKPVNMFGITETTVHVTYKEIEEEEIRSNHSNIGKPLPDTTAYVMDRCLKLSPRQVAGEICVGGNGVARGYLNNPGLTAEKFIANPYQPGERLYRSGDLVKRTGTNDMEYIGRSDRQFQLRGYRVEPGEIENKLLQKKEIKEAIVMERKSEQGEQYLCAYIVTGEKFPAAGLREYLQGEIPDYMIPNYFVCLDKVPLTANGKVDRERLPEPNAGPMNIYTPPANEVENRLAAVWQEVLNLERVGVTDNYFQVGGDSIKAIRLISSINTRFNSNLGIGDLYTHQTIAELGNQLDREKENMIKARAMEAVSAEIEAFKQKISGNNPDAEIEDIFPMSDIEKGMAYYYVKDSADAIFHNQVIYQQNFENFDVPRMEKALGLMIKKHTILRTGFLVEQSAHVVYKYDDSFAGIEFRDVTHLGKTARENQVNKYARESRHQPFNLSKPPLWRLMFFKTRPRGIAVVWEYYHAIIDGWSNASFFTELNNIYHRLQTEPGFVPENLKSGYKEFIIEQLMEMKNPLTREYWKKELQDYKRLNFPATLISPGRKELKSLIIDMGFQFREDLHSLAEQQGTTLKHLCLAAYIYMLNMISYENDITTGMVTNIRPLCADGDKILGCLLNTVPFRMQIPLFIRWSDLITLVDQKMKALKWHERLSLLEIQKTIGEKTGEQHPIFDSVFNYIDFHVYHGMEHRKEQLELEEELELESYEKSNFSFAVNINAFENNFLYFCEYSTAVISEEDARRLQGYFTAILNRFLHDVDGMVDKSHIIPLAEKKKLLEVFNANSRGDTVDKTIHWLFREQVRRTPNRTALVGAEQEGWKGRRVEGKKEEAPFGQINACGEGHLSYGELNKQSDQLAHLLREKGIGPDSVVGLMMERSLEMIIGILGILKAGGAYLPIDPGYPRQRIQTMLNDSGTRILLTQRQSLAPISITPLRNIQTSGPGIKPVVTAAQAQITDFDRLPFPDRTLIDYNKYHQYIGEAPVKHAITLQATRGCPYDCSFCHKIWPKKHVVRSAENIFTEISYCYDAGIRRFVFIDDIFNLEKKNSSRLLETIIKSKMDVQLFFPNGLRGDILEKDFIDLMIAAGTINIAVALESASPRVQKLINKNLHLEKFKENIHYIAQRYPGVILEMEMIHGFPGETQEEALMTLDFLKSIKWVHFPNLHVLKIFPNTNIYKLAIESGISPGAIERSTNLGFHQLPETLPFPRQFTQQCQVKLMSEYFLLKERLQQVLPAQMEILTEDELVRKYDSYLPGEIKNFSDILQYMEISPEELGEVTLIKEDYCQAPGFSQEISKYFPKTQPDHDAFRCLLLDLSHLFTPDRESIMYHQTEEPLGLLYLLTYLNEQFKNRIRGKVFKSGIDFDNYEELKTIITDFNPDLIGIRTLSYFKDFFHKTVLLIRQWGVTVPIIAGGPYATSDYQFLLQDDNIDLAVLGEGEIILANLVQKMMENGKKLPAEEVLQEIHGIAFIKNKDKERRRGKNREIILLDEITGNLNQYPVKDLRAIGEPGNLLYVLYTSGSTGKPKAVLLEHQSLVNLIHYQYTCTGIDFSRVLQFTTITFDVSAQEIFSTLLAGGQLFLIPREALSDIPQLLGTVANDNIKTLFLPASFLKFVTNEEEYIKLLPPGVSHIVTAGEQPVINDKFSRYLEENHVYFHNHYGPSETHVVTALTLEPTSRIPGLPPIGKPVLNTTAYILDKNSDLQPVGISGELYIGGIQVGRGYLNNTDLTAEKFDYDLWDYQDYHDGYHRSYRSHMSYIYRTGDLARWLSDGNLEFLGRIDYQVKIRGFRVELGEIETQLLKHSQIKEAVAALREDEKGNQYLCAYIVPHRELDTSGVREYLKESIPDYMVPSFLVCLEKIPLTSSLKIDRRALPAPGVPAAENDMPPGNPLEEKLAAIWADVLNVKKDMIGIKSNFFELGGHSLSAVVMAARVHREYQVKLPLGKIFKIPTIKALADYIKAAGTNLYHPIVPVEKKEYYPLSSAQKRIYMVQQLEFQSTAYHLPLAVVLEGKLEKEQLQGIFQHLVKRHESLRTSFHALEKGPVQRIHDEVELGIKYCRSLVIGHWSLVNEEEQSPGNCQGRGEVSSPIQMEKIINNFIRPFDLSRAPLLRVGLVQEGKEDRYLLMVDMHHIISDGVSHEILLRDFQALYEGKQPPPLKLQYKDYSQWQTGMPGSKQSKNPEQYWLNQFAGEIPVLNMPTDYPRPAVRDFKGEYITFTIEPGVYKHLQELSGQTGATLFMVLLAVLNILLARYTGQEDIVIGSPAAGRTHADLEQIVGMFVGQIPLRNRIDSSKTFREFLAAVKQTALEAYENQDYPFDNLIANLGLQGDSNRNPLFDIVFAVDSPTFPGFQLTGLKVKSWELQVKTSKTDLRFGALPAGDGITMILAYSTQLYKRTSCEKMLERYQDILAQVVENPGVKLADITISHGLSAAGSTVLEQEKQGDFGF